MSSSQEHNVIPLKNIDQMIAYYEEGIKPRHARRVGTEHEKFLFDLNTGKLLTYEGPRGIESILTKMKATSNWEGVFDQGKLIGLSGADGAISLEPGGQFELSGHIRKTIFETEKELTRHFNELAFASEGVAAVCWGLNPWDSLDEVPWMPKSRYKIMRAYLPTKGKLAHWMMKMTCTIQANLDYRSEEDAMDAVRTALLVTPFVNALFANSPWKEGKASGFQSYRAKIWTQTDNDRTGIPPFMIQEDWGFREYINWALDVPMFFIQRGEKLIEMAGHSFRNFMKEGYKGYHSTMGDFELHLSTVFPEVRLKKYFEVRSADGGDFEFILALPAFWKGIIYDSQARKSAKDLLGHLSYEELHDVLDSASKFGLYGKTERVDLFEITNALVHLAGEGLDRIATEEGHASERPFLKPLKLRLRNKREDSLSDALSKHSRLEMIQMHDALISYPK